MFRTIIWVIYFVGKLIFSIPDIQKAKSLEKQGQTKERAEFSNRVIRNMCKKFITLSGSKVKVSGKENIPKNDAVLFVSNHQSYFDILIFVACIPKSKGFIAKDDLKKFPLLRNWMEYVNCVLIERGNPRKGLLAIKEGIKLLKGGYSMVLFPEGTRSVNGELNEFKPGSLRLATKSGVPVVPVTIKGAHGIMPKGKLVIRPVDVEIIISPPIYMDEEVDSNALTEKVQNIIAKELER